MSRAERVTPASLLDDIFALTIPQLRTFFILLGEHLSADALGFIIRSLNSSERTRLGDVLRKPVSKTERLIIGPCTEDEADDQLANPHSCVETPNLEDAANAAFEEVFKELAPAIQGVIEGVVQKEVANYKSKRNRKSDPDTIKRNVEICDLRKQDRKKWSLRKLAKHFNVTDRAITLVLKDEDKWRRLGTEELVPPQEGTGSSTGSN